MSIFPDCNGRWTGRMTALIVGAACLTAPCAWPAEKAAALQGGAHTPTRVAKPASAEADQLETLPGFKVESILKADPKINGSWISMAKDPKGRLLLGGQKGQPVTRVTLSDDGQVQTQEDLKLPVSETMGLLFVGDTLYVNGTGPGPNRKSLFGLFRCTSTNGDD